MKRTRSPRFRLFVILLSPFTFRLGWPPKNTKKLASRQSLDCLGASKMAGASLMFQRSLELITLLPSRLCRARRKNEEASIPRLAQLKSSTVKTSRQRFDILIYYCLPLRLKKLHFLELIFSTSLIQISKNKSKLQCCDFTLQSYTNQVLLISQQSKCKNEKYLQVQFNIKLNYIDVKMISQQSSLFIDHQAPISFSFDNMPRQEAPKQSIAQFLRLRTNQSVEDHPLCSIQLKKQHKKSLKSEQSQIDDQHCLRLVQQQYDLRMQSLIKQYQLKLNKQQEFYKLRQWKLKQELETLEKQNSSLLQQIRKVKISAKVSQNHCPLCSDGQIVNQLTKLLSQNEENHKNCLQQKKEYSRKQNQMRAKFQVLEQENEKLNTQLRNLNKQNRIYQFKCRETQDQCVNLRQKLKQNGNILRENLYNFELQSKKLQRQLNQKSVELNQSKATVKSVLTTTQQSMKSSYLQTKDSRQEKQNEYCRGRKSVNKMIFIEDQNCKQPQSRSCLRKINENLPRNSTNQKYEALGWKYF